MQCLPARLSKMRNREYDHYIISHPPRPPISVLRLGEIQTLLWMAANPPANPQPQSNYSIRVSSQSPAVQ